jgi:hypothetical protein
MNPTGIAAQQMLGPGPTGGTGVSPMRGMPSMMGRVGGPPPGLSDTILPPTGSGMSGLPPSAPMPPAEDVTPAEAMPRMSPTHMKDMAKAQKQISAIEKALVKIKELLGSDMEEEKTESMPSAAMGGVFTPEAGGVFSTPEATVNHAATMWNRMRSSRGGVPWWMSQIQNRTQQRPPMVRMPQQPPQMVTSPDMGVVGPMPQQPPQMVTSPGMGVGYGGAMPRAATGGTFAPGIAADNSYGGAATAPTITYSSYTPEQMGKMPFIQKLRGTTNTPQFAGFGAPLSNAQFGIENMPSLIDMQAYRDLYPTEKDMAQSLYQQGLSTDFRDILERSRRATPYGTSYGATAYR